MTINPFETTCRLVLQPTANIGFQSSLCNVWVLDFDLYCGMRVVCRFQNLFQSVKTVSGCDRELDAHFYSAASLKYYDPDT